ncbi:MAG TPA: STM4015 family protein [Actinospica sp.]|nr:STM4015 family protein [Actinospica sp.]
MIEEFRYDALTEFHGLPVYEFGFRDPAELETAEVPRDVAARAWRVGIVEYDEADAEEVFALFLASVDTTRIKALILAAWHGEISGEGVDRFQQALLAAADRFPALEALFISDVPQDMAEISWIEQEDPAELLAAFPRLRVLGMRGWIQGPVKPFAHERLEELVLQSGGLPAAVVRAVCEGSLPALTSLDLYLGTRQYGGDTGVEDLGPILAGTAFPGLRHLGLRDAEIADELAAALAHAPVVARLESLDLSLGALGDGGASALLAGQPLNHLRRLDLHHHFLSEPMIERLEQALPEVDLDLSERKQPHEWRGEQSRYIAISE